MIDTLFRQNRDWPTYIPEATTFATRHLLRDLLFTGVEPVNLFTIRNGDFGICVTPRIDRLNYEHHAEPVQHPHWRSHFRSFDC
ncbi:hypothetical protein RRG08_055696 [Elysia crispata]|uniref:Uncharacterized protein n=1 Tax=Elysia crispata TaxID=231223 RepID=A0AAE1E793_9GAST|nr:hypothetical protein RRG08_055696 [Elysia crispata]